ncbi:MAG: ECF transporter S component [Spirochaetia bacterium]|nr:ECF transporter S component [Spirochaetia bacterium]MBR4797342.1 ECF transporter S component [Spirochaetia bacterium]MBR5017169.1 ECF transporter S component [Spirochaetia bacterium]
MTNTLLIQRRKPLSISVQAAATVLAIVAAVAVPQFFHWLGIVSGAGKAPGVAFSPMHLPIILVGFLAGPYAGAISGLLGPVAAHYMSGMPNAVQLPFMMVELMGYGLSAGLLRYIRLPLVAKTLIAMVAGRVFRMFACIIAFYLLGNDKMLPLSIWTSIPRVLPGIVLQLVLIPLIVFRVESRDKD